MTNRFADKLAALGLQLPTTAAPIASYVPFVQANGLLFVSGQIPWVHGKLLHQGLLGETVSLAQGIACAEACGLGLLAHIASACGGDPDRLRKVVKLTCYVACNQNFTDIAKVANGASDLMQKVFGEAGRHARTSIGCAALPIGAPVEVDAIVELAT